MKKIKIEPVTRIEGHLNFEVEVEDGKALEARASGVMFRGFEIFLKGRHPLDANRLTQRICGVCPAVHSAASALCLDEALGLTGLVPENGRLIRDLILGCNFLQSHILHFYHLAALDYVDIRQAGLPEGHGPLDPLARQNFKIPEAETGELIGSYLAALEERKNAHEALAIFGGKMPHNVGIVPGGTEASPSLDKIADLQFRVKRLKSFVENRMLKDVLTVAKYYPEYWDIGKGVARYLSYGVFDFFISGVYENGSVAPVDTGKITESVYSSFYASSGDGRPETAETKPEEGKKTAYSWIKAPRYDGKAFEVGPSARFFINYKNNPGYKKQFEKISGITPDLAKMSSVLGRHLSRVVETCMICDLLLEMLLKLDPGKPSNLKFAVPREGKGAGLVDGPRGALGHWIKIKDGVIENYQCVVPTTWNASPKDENGRPGPMEQAVIGTEIRDPENPVEALRIIRSFDPCLACSVHAAELKNPKG